MMMWMNETNPIRAPSRRGGLVLHRGDGEEVQYEHVALESRMRLERRVRMPCARCAYPSEKAKVIPRTDAMYAADAKNGLGDDDGGDGEGRPTERRNPKVDRPTPHRPLPPSSHSALPMPKELLRRRRPQDIVKPRDKHREEDLFPCRPTHRRSEREPTHRAKYDAQLLKNGG